MTLLVDPPFVNKRPSSFRVRRTMSRIEARLFPSGSRSSFKTRLSLTPRFLHESWASDWFWLVLGPPLSAKVRWIGRFSSRWDRWLVDSSIHRFIELFINLFKDLFIYVNSHIYIFLFFHLRIYRANFWFIYQFISAFHLFSDRQDRIAAYIPS